MEVERLVDGPIVETGDRVGDNVNGPSVISAPSWVDDPLGEYYCYFAHHRGEYVRLAVADDVRGPWRLYEPGVLHVSETPFAGHDDGSHVASPDVHVDPEHERVRMYYHGAPANGEDPSGTYGQCTRVATSPDGLSVQSREEALGRFYFRVFEYDGWYYALAKENRGPDQTESGQRVYRSLDGLTGFERGPLLFEDGSRHTALRRRGDELDVFYSRIGDAPERILLATVDLAAPWSSWEATEPEPVLEPAYDWEGADCPIEPSTLGASMERVNQLRDPAILEDDGRTYLFYTVAGEQGIAVAAIRDETDA